MKRGCVRWYVMSCVVSGLLLTGTSVAAPQSDADWVSMLQEAAAKPTPRTADGRPDLTGHWADQRRRGALLIETVDEGNTVLVYDRDAPELDTRAQVNFKTRAAARASENSPGPKYKPEYVLQHREMMLTGSHLDPGIHCYPLGVPRLGAPTEIVQKSNAVYFMYSGQRAHRIIPIGGAHSEDWDPYPEGDSIAFWEGDTLVVDVVNLDPYTWLTRDGDVHSDQMRVTERLTRKGDTLEYEVIVDDPVMYEEPWKPVAGFTVERIGARTMILGEGTHSSPAYPCVERDRANKVNNDRF